MKMLFFLIATNVGFLILPAGAATRNQSSYETKPWIRATKEVGLDGVQASRLKFANLNGDNLPDAVLLQNSSPTTEPRVFVNQGSDSTDDPSPRFIEILDTGLPILSREDVLIFADLNNDGKQDAILGRYLDIYQKDYSPPASSPHRSSWFPGNGDGTFAKSRTLENATIATTRAMAVGDVNEDGLPDLFIGNWYERYFSGYEAFENDLLLQVPSSEGPIQFARWPLPNESLPTDFQADLNGRPTYGTVILRLDDGLPMLLELNYGRRWNRLYKMNTRGPIRELEDYPYTRPEPGELAALSNHLTRHLKGRDIAPETGVDGDEIRHGRHPNWKKKFANDKPRSTRPDEPPFRSNGNTFDAAVGDIDNDGDFDLFLSTIYHAWAGDSSDLSRFLVNQLNETGRLSFATPKHVSVNRLPPRPASSEELEEYHIHQNQGDIYAEIADLNQDGLLDLVLCSSDYPDEPPYEERLRLFFQQSDGSFADLTSSTGIDHVGAGMPSLADVDLDGDLDILVGQSFNRLPTEKRRAAAYASGALSPNNSEKERPERRAVLFLNPANESSHSLTISLTGDPKQKITSDAFGTVIRVTADLDNDPATPDVTQTRQLLGPGGHAGKQNQFIIHFGLRDADQAKRVEVTWPNPQRKQTILENVPAGHHSIAAKDSL